jgi:sRNA-binding protein
MTDVKNEVVAVSADDQQNEKQEVKKRDTAEDFLREKKARIRQAVDWLAQAFPLCFNVKEPKPLKFKIEHDILNQWIYLSSLPYERPMPSRLLLRKAVAWYATRSTYYAAFDKATHRIDLDGKEVTEITEAEKVYAREKIEVIKKLRKARKEIKA